MGSGKGQAKRVASVMGTIKKSSKQEKTNSSIPLEETEWQRKERLLNKFKGRETFLFMGENKEEASKTIDRLIADDPDNIKSYRRLKRFIGKNNIDPQNVPIIINSVLGNKKGEDQYSIELMADFKGFKDDEPYSWFGADIQDPNLLKEMNDVMIMVYENRLPDSIKNEQLNNALNNNINF